MKEAEPLYFETAFIKVAETDGATVYIGKAIANLIDKQTKNKSIDAPQSSEEAVQMEPAKTNNEGCFGLGALFDETNNVDVIPVESDDSDSEIEDFGAPNSFQAAWFQAKEIEETKSASAFKAVAKNLKDELS